jgi:hypothetical protein
MTTLECICLARCNRGADMFAVATADRVAVVVAKIDAFRKANLRCVRQVEQVPNERASPGCGREEYNDAKTLVLRGIKSPHEASRLVCNILPRLDFIA